MSVKPKISLAPVRHERLAEQVYESLFHLIMSGKLPPRSKLPSEVALASEFGVSRPIVRQALSRLRDARLIMSVRGSGTLVCSTPQPIPVAPLARDPDTLQHFLYGLELRLVVEPECAYLAAKRRSAKDIQRIRVELEGFEKAALKGDTAHHFDFGFHRNIAKATGNPRLLQVIDTLEYDLSHAVSLWRHLARETTKHNLQAALAEHREIFKFIQSQEANAARRAMHRHLENARMRLLEVRENTER